MDNLRQQYISKIVLEKWELMNVRKEAKHLKKCGHLLEMEDNIPVVDDLFI